MALRGSLLLLLIWGAYHLTAQSEASLSVEIRDASGEISPAMVCITSLADGKWRTPPDGTTAPSEIGRPKLLEVIADGKVIRSAISELRSRPE